VVSGRNDVRVHDAVETLGQLPGATGTTEPLRLDVTDPASITAAAEHISGTLGRVDILVHNAGIHRNAEGMGRHDVFREILDANTVAPLVVTEAFLPLLRVQGKGSSSGSQKNKKRLVFVSSSTGSLAFASDPKNPFSMFGSVEYRSSKAALNMVMLQMHSRLKGEGILVFAADPGLVITNLTGSAETLRKRGGAEPEVGGERVAAVVRGDRDADVGKLCSGDGVVTPF
jgi:NAD(P)-dependent dehydrogenase (short-subunit alcohol dehydrogenase family)